MRGTNALYLIAALFTLMACVIPTASTPVPTLDPGAVNTYIAQTANAAASQTAAAIPTHTATITFTPTPRETASPTPTATVTFVFILPGLGGSSTLPASTLANLNNGTAESDYACKIISQEPANNTVYDPRADFTVSWFVKNIGKKDWFRATTQYVYISGDKLHKVQGYSIPKGAESGRNVTLNADMEAFKDKGTYSTKWALVSEGVYFCNLTLTIVVK